MAILFSALLITRFQIRYLQSFYCLNDASNNVEIEFAGVLLLILRVFFWSWKLMIYLIRKPFQHRFQDKVNNLILKVTFLCIMIVQKEYFGKNYGYYGKNIYIRKLHAFAYF